MSGIDQAGGARQAAPARTTPVGPPAGAVTAPIRAASPAGDRAEAGLEATIVKMGPPYGRLLAAAQANDPAAARAALAELQPLLEAGRALAAGSPYAAAYAKVDAAAAAVGAQLPAGERTSVMVGLPGRGGRMVEAPRAPEAAPKGPLAWLDGVARAVGGGLAKALHVAFLPLELAGKALDPVRSWAGQALGGAKAAIDGSVGQIPVLGQAVRFTTGLASSLVGLVDGALQGVTHPVELLQGLGTIAWTAVGLVPGVRTAWDMAVEGKGFRESLGGAWREAGGVATALFDGALKDAKAGNWAGALGRVTGDVGSFFMTGGAAGGAKAAAVGGQVGRAAKVARLGLGTIGAANQLGARIMVGGLKLNVGAWGRVGKLASRLPGGQRLVAIGEGVAARLRPAVQAPHAGKAPGAPLAAPAAVMERPKAASRLAPELLAGEIRPAAPLSHEAAIARQAEVLAELERTPWLHEALPEKVISGMIDAETAVLKAAKGLRLDGKPVATMEEAAKAWKALPADSPVRAQVGKQLAAAIQQGWQDGLGFPPATVEFRALPENLAGMETRGKVLIDPAVLGEDLDFVVHVLAEEQTHAYQRFLVENREALAIPKRVGVEIEKYARDFATETYVYPPGQALTGFAEDVKRLSAGVADHADEIDYAAIRRRLVKDFAEGTPARAKLDAWWGVVGDESKRLSYMKLAAEELKLATRNGTERIWRMDFAERLPPGILAGQGATLNAADAAAALQRAIAQSQGKLNAANGEVAAFVKAWDDAYRGQALEFAAKATADQVAQWILAQ